MRTICCGGTGGVYGQYGKGQNIPPSSVFDVRNAAVAILPNPTLTPTYQTGSVWKGNRFTLDVDTFHIHFENDYSSAADPLTGEPVYYLAGAAVTKGVEAESNILLAPGFSVYLNATNGSARYENTGLSVQQEPQDTKTNGRTQRLPELHGRLRAGEEAVGVALTRGSRPHARIRRILIRVA
jgi:iron complex outermembrane receptor protein